jgi:hypothetical protein
MQLTLRNLTKPRMNPAKAIEYLETTEPYELNPYQNLYPAYVRGQAKLVEKDAAGAAEESQASHR